MQRLFEFKYQPDHSIMSHISAIEHMASQLNDLNEPVSEVQLMTKILVTLPPSYRHFLSVWDNVPSEDRNIQLLTQRLMKEENVTKLYNCGHTDAADQAFFSGNHTSHPPRENSFTQSFRGQRGTHSRRGRNSFGPRRGGRDPRGSSSHLYNKSTQCFYCGDFNHVYANCRSRIRNEREGKPNNNFSNIATSNQPIYGPSSNEQQSKFSQERNTDFSVQSSTSHVVKDNHLFYADSGATRHMTGNKNIIRNLKPIESGSWFVSGIGNTRLLVQGEGDVEAVTTNNSSQSTILIKNVLYVPKLGINLFSIGATTSNGITAVFTKDKVNFYRDGVLHCAATYT